MSESSPKVLVVDDDSSLTELLVDTLDVIGYESFKAESAREALEIMHHEHVDLVISDINMPEMSGIELLEQIKRENTAMPVMLITGISSTTIKDQAFSKGADGFLAKPFRIRTIESEIGKLLSGVKRRKIALIDDNEEFLMSLAQRLEEKENTVYSFRTVAEARAFLEKNKVDLIITDLKMPDGDGISLTNDLRQHHPDVPIVMVTAYATANIVQQMKKLGVQKLLAKPLDFNQLETVVEELVGT
jgi:DNA-binding NtrC family response regulator